MIGLVDVNNCFVSCERVFNRSLVGRPVAVLSNNDGCCVARSNEFKALGIAMGTPYFQLKDREKSGELVFCSSNYELYGDMSRRLISILRDEALDVEQYSIDEAFIMPPNNPDLGYAEYGKRLRAKILRWIGLPCGIGFAPTKTLAKIADHIAKKRPEGVYVLPDDPTDILADLPSDEVWGVGRRLVVKLRAERIFTAKDLRDARDDVIRSVGGGDFLARTVMFPAPTDATNEILKAIREEVDALYIPGTRYRKTGVVFFGLEKADAPKQLDLFSHPSSSIPHPSKLYKTIDALNKRYGKGKVFSARHSLTLGLARSNREPRMRGGYAEGLGDRSWKMKRGKLSKRPTTR